MPPEVLERHAEQEHDDYVEAETIGTDYHHILHVGRRNDCRTAGLAFV